MQSRRGFFASLASLGKVSEEKQPFHPLLPGFIAEQSHKCQECETSACKNVCEEEIVIREANSVPFLDFSRRGCTFCGECAKACEYDCFVAEPVNDIDVKVEIGILECLAWNKTICQSCSDACNEKAIQFTGLWNPQIVEDQCTGCGFCIGVCPSYSIQIFSKGQG